MVFLLSKTSEKGFTSAPSEGNEHKCVYQKAEGSWRDKAHEAPTCCENADP